MKIDLNNIFVIVDLPAIENRPLQIVNESDRITLSRDISSNPLSNVSWYNTTDLLITQMSVTTASFTIERATCTDTMNYTLVASYLVGNMVTSMVELIVNCEFSTRLDSLLFFNRIFQNFVSSNIVHLMFFIEQTS